jgi:hypothetical protein
MLRSPSIRRAKSIAFAFHVHRMTPMSFIFQLSRGSVEQLHPDLNLIAVPETYRIHRASFHFQVIAPLFFPLDIPNCAVG